MLDTDAGLAEIVTTSRTGADVFTGWCHHGGPGTAYGGHVAAQALWSAGQTVEPGRAPHSLHAYFVRPGDVTRQIDYHVDLIRDGGSFSVRRVDAVQGAERIFTMTSSFKTAEDGIERATPMPVTPPPDALIDSRDLGVDGGPMGGSAIADYVDVRYVTDPWVGSLAPSGMGSAEFWVRSRGPVPDDDLVRFAMITYMSDLNLASVSAYPHRRPLGGLSPIVSSIDHSLWLRAPSVDGWLLVSQVNQGTTGGRGMSHASIFSRGGALVASVAQENLLRWRR